MERDLTAVEFQRFHDHIYTLTGIHYPPEKIALLSNRLRRRLRACKQQSYDAYLTFLQNRQNAGEVQEFIDSVTTNETYFFRCQRHWDWFKAWAQDRAKEPETRRNGLRIWSAAASCGAEAGTILIVLDQLLGRGFGGIRVEVLGTDLNASILEEAREGIYRPYALAQTPPDIVKKYFKKLGEDQFEFDRELARHETFARHNLMEPLRGRTFDFVFLRNVMIYFDAPSKERVLSHVHDILTPGGIVMVGESESLMNIKHPFTYLKPSIFQKPLPVKARG
ncbi:MAG: methyltransferase domain-containing protein [Planctomycetes bacterium]|nr:methyltransferase domain-containing protein [Planctomycetota bacterium]